MIHAVAGDSAIEGKDIFSSKLKMNWMSCGCQGIINNQFGSLMITMLPCSRMSCSERVTVTLAHAAHPGQQCSEIDLYTIDLRNREAWPTHDKKALLIGLCWDKSKLKKGGGGGE